MTDTSPLPLSASFEPATREAWLALVDKVLAGADFDKRLVSRTADGLRIEPLYTRADAVAGEAGTGRTGWDIRTIVVESDPGAANTALLEDLEGGATSVALQIDPGGGLGLAPTEGALATALAGVNLDMCGLALVPLQAFWEAAGSLEAIWTDRGIGAEARQGAFGADPLGTLAATGSLNQPLDRALILAGRLARTALPMPSVTALLTDGVPYHNAGASEAQELAAMLATLVAYLRAAEAESVPPDRALPKIAVSLAADADQFLTIAKFRAARRLVARVAEACGAVGAASRVRLGAATSYRMMTKRDPWTNILRSAMACAGAALGGADSIVVLPFTFALGKPDAFARRIARNTQLVLAEEASLGRVADPAAGSWYVDSLTRDLAEKAWVKFQDIESKGGMAAVLTSGFIQEEIARAATVRAHDFATRRLEITGVSAFPKLGSDGVTVQPWPRLSSAPRSQTVAVEALRAARLAEPFEALRDAAEKTEGPPPRIFLANLGPAAEHTRQTAWAQNFFAAGGIETISSEGLEAPDSAADAFARSGAAAACLCGTTNRVRTAGAEMAAALRRAGARHVYVAGRPADDEGALAAAGTDRFLFASQDALAALAQVHRDLGLAHSVRPSR